jgi:hypothetical protein
MADGSFTRSLYIGKDKTAEVLKRKETVEKELMARFESKNGINFLIMVIC